MILCDKNVDYSILILFFKYFSPVIKTVPHKKTKEDDPGNINFSSIVVAIFGGLAGLMILTSCYIICKYTFQTYI